MSPYVYVLGHCFGCGRTFGFNPDTVPSYDPSLDDPSRPEGRRPICEACITLVNANRRRSGLPLWPVAADAYEPAEAGG